MITSSFIMSAGSSVMYCILLLLALNAKLPGANATDSPTQGVAYDDCGDTGQRTEGKKSKAPTEGLIKLDCSDMYVLKTDGPQKYEIGKGGGQIVIHELDIPPLDYVYLRNIKCPAGNCTAVRLDISAVPPLQFKALPRFSMQTKERNSKAVVKFTCTRNSDKRGKCPVPTGTGVCRDSCSNDKDCPGTLKCCSNGCGHMCTAPEEVKLGKRCESDEQCAVYAACEEDGKSKRICKCKENFAPSRTLPDQCIPTTSRADITLTLSQPWDPAYLDASSSEYVRLKDIITSEITEDESFIAIEELKFFEENGITKVSYVLITRYREGISGEKKKRSTWTSPTVHQKSRKRDLVVQLKDMVRSTMKGKGLKYDTIEVQLVGKPEQFCYNKNDCVMENARCISKGCACVKGFSEDMTKCLP